MVDTCEWCQHWNLVTGCTKDVPEEDVHFCDKFEEREVEQMNDEEKQEPMTTEEPMTTGERAKAERALKSGCHPIQGEQENDTYKI